MSDQSKRFYFIKLKSNFFKRHDSKILKDMDPAYLLIYLELLCESADHDGELRFSEEIPYTRDMLAVVIGEDKEVFNKAYDVLKQLRLLVEFDDGSICLPKLGEMVGSWADTPEANKKRNQQIDKIKSETSEKIAQREQSGKNFPEGREKNSRGAGKKFREVGNDFPESIEYRDKSIEYRDISISKDIDTSSDIHKSKSKDMIISSKIDDIIGQFNSICLSLPKVTKITETRKKTIKARLNDYSLEDLITVFEKAEASDFLSGRNKQWTSCSFDWLMKPSNLIKVLEGNYDNKGQKQGGSYIDAINNRYDVVDAWYEGRRSSD